MDAPTSSGLLDLDGQSVFWEEWGNPEGVPALYLHGGPGSVLRSGYRQRFDLDRFRLVGMQQRGAGRSVPLAGEPGHDLGANTTQQLIADIEALRKHLGIERWLLNGVSWGATLTLAYAQAHRDRVAGIVLMAVTTTSAEEIHWITEGCQMFYPEAWDELATWAEQHQPGYLRGEAPLVAVMAEVLRSSDRDQQIEAARAWGRWEDWHMSIGSGYAAALETTEPDVAVPFATLVTHYWSHHAFLEPPILDRMNLLLDIPAVLIHGRKDVSGPAVTPWLLHQQWPASELVIVEDEGHGGPQMVDAWSRANAAMAERLRPQIDRLA
jgi:proline iminopeptidase